MSKVAVIGAGSWGTTFSKVLADDGSDVMLCAKPENMDGLAGLGDLIATTHMSDTPQGE